VVDAGQGYELEVGLIGSLVAEYGVSGAEEPVRKKIRSLLPE
jgi:hypothetical protein